MRLTLIMHLPTQRGQHEAEISVRWRDEFRLICDPFFQRLPPASQECVLARRSYDLVYLGKRKQGTWHFRLSLEGSGDRMHLVLQQFHQRRKNLRCNSEETLRLPMYFDGNSGCIHIGERNKTIDELGLGLPAQPDDTEEADAYATEELEREPDPDSDDGPETVSTTNPGIGPDPSQRSDLNMFSEPSGPWLGETEGMGAEISTQQTGEPSDVLPSCSPQKTRRVKPQRSLMNAKRFGWHVDPYKLAWKCKKSAYSSTD